MRELRTLPFADLGFATVDHHRPLRNGSAEVVFGLGKTAAQIAAIAEELLDKGDDVLVTRAAPDAMSLLRARFDDAVVHEVARAVTVVRSRRRAPMRGPVAVVTAGTSDLPVAEEAAVTLSFFGSEVLRVNDVGVAGIHRLLAKMETIERASVVIVIAGMEGALASVIGGLSRRPVIAVPTSIGYGAAFEGLAALLGMLTTCAAGVTVVNIDNGFGAAYAATTMNRMDE
jgi:NCAIR mutase (PurE)-related protein